MRNCGATLTKLSVDGENVDNKEFLELIEEVKDFEKLSIYFGESLKDSFLYCL